ncbi:MAG: trypsin-like peptidase domain-containing protein [Anaerolineae bacterium]|nr:trypsin-like peptidase domain-containing protein [Anaerolineae bacterium]
MRSRLRALVAAGVLLLGLSACVPCGAPGGTARRSPEVTPSATAQVAPPGYAGSLREQEQLLVELYRRAGPAVVNLRVTKHADAGFRFQPEEGEPPEELVRGQGSGFVIDREGHIVTNYHVVEGAEEVLVIFSDGDQARATVVGTDPDSDLAVIKADHLPELEPLELAESDEVHVGQLAIAIGNPFGLQGSLTTGIVSAVGRTLPLGRESTTVGGRFSIPRMIQTDAAINPGNSGGPLLDSSGRVIGVNTAINAREGVSSGVGFAVPVCLIRRIVPQLIKEGRYSYPWLGVTGRDVNPDIAEAMGLPERRGALIVDIIKGSPADRAGLRGTNRTVTVHDTQLDIGGDVIIAINDTPVRQFDDVLVYLIERASVGQRLKLTVLRNGTLQTVEVQLGERPRD